MDRQGRELTRTEMSELPSDECLYHENSLVDMGTKTLSGWYEYEGRKHSLVDMGTKTLSGWYEYEGRKLSLVGMGAKVKRKKETLQGFYPKGGARFSKFLQ